MPARLAIAGGNAKTASANLGTKNPGSVTIQSALISVARMISPAKTWGYLAKLLGTTERVSKHRLYGSREFTADEIAALLRSEDGIHYLVALMDRARPQWWRTLLKMGVLGGIERRREADMNLMRKIANVSDQTAAELPAALMVQDAEFYSPVFEALDAVARAPGGALGGKGRK